MSEPNDPLNARLSKVTNMSWFRLFRGKLRRKVVLFCALSSLLLFVYVSLKLLTAHETDAIAVVSRRLDKRKAGGGGDEDNDDDEKDNRDVIPPPLSQNFKVIAGGDNKTDLNKVIVPYKVSPMRVLHGLY